MHIVSSTFANKHRAVEVLAELGDLDLDWGVPLDHAAAALTINLHGKVRVHRSHEAGATGVITAPWRFYSGNTLDLKEKLEGIRRFADDIIHPLR